MLDKNKSENKGRILQTIDSEHEYFFKLIKQVNKAAHSGKDVDVSTWRNELLAYAHIHFMNEERMAEYCLNNWSRRAELIRQHRYFGELLTDEERLKDAAQFQRFLQDWITNHINGIDREMLEEFKRKCNGHCSECEPPEDAQFPTF